VAELSLAAQLPVPGRSAGILSIVYYACVQLVFAESGVDGRNHVDGFGQGQKRCYQGSRCGFECGRGAVRTEAGGYFPQSERCAARYGWDDVRFLAGVRQEYAGLAGG
jgi:hypothetical protein